MVPAVVQAEIDGGDTCGSSRASGDIYGSNRDSGNTCGSSTERQWRHLWFQLQLATAAVRTLWSVPLRRLPLSPTPH